MTSAKTKEYCDRAFDSAQSLRSGEKLPFLNIFVSWLHAKPDDHYAYALFDGIECFQSSDGIDTVAGMEDPSRTTVKGIS
jgi:hypothetical protein